MVVEAPREVSAEVNYLHNRAQADGSPLEFWSEEDARSTMIIKPGTPVPVHDVRPRRDTLSLDENGFVLVDHRSAVSNLELLQMHPLVDQHYAHEMSDLLARVTGAD